MGFWEFRGKRLSLHTPRIMGILNVTPDSFFDGGKYTRLERALERAFELVEQGADMIDIGAESSRPGSKRISVEEELRRLMPVLERLVQEGFPLPISVDTTKPRVAREALEVGAEILNDIRGFRDRELLLLAKEYQAGLVVMHMKGSPENMQDNPFYTDPCEEILVFFRDRLEEIQKLGISLTSVVLDPGIGFGKRLEDNLEIFANLPRFCQLGVPLLVGASRKSFIRMICGPSAPRLGGSIAAHLWCISQNVRIVRVHDVLEMKEALEVWRAIEERRQQGLKI
ncbi:MAG: dihydropteroate synthase [Planctomycetota bacterium]|nr:MAG: dihydropteroate synthase [Planctomycetota bacterium]